MIKVINIRELEKSFKAKNNNIVVQLFDETETLANGIKLQDTRGKRDIVAGTCLLAEEKCKIPKFALVWFPLYSANLIKLSGETLFIVNFDDIILIEKVEE